MLAKLEIFNARFKSLIWYCNYQVKLKYGKEKRNISTTNMYYLSFYKHSVSAHKQILLIWNNYTSYVYVIKHVSFFFFFFLMKYSILDLTNMTN